MQKFHCLRNLLFKIFRYYDEDRYSDHRSLHRSISHPSLARSESEFMEQWVAPIDEMSSPEASPRMRRQRVLVKTDFHVFCSLLMKIN